MKTIQQFEAYIGVDLGDRKHFICVNDKNGNLLKEFSIPNEREHLAKLIKDFPSSALAMEAGTHSPWISRYLSSLGAVVTVANPRKTRLIYNNDRKSDSKDAAMLAKLLRLDPELLYPIKHISESGQSTAAILKARDAAVRARTALINSTRGILKSFGLRLPACSSSVAHRRLSKLMEAHPEITTAFQGTVQILEMTTHQIKCYDEEIELASQYSEPAKLLRSIPGVGPITSLAFVLAIEDPQRFEDRRDVGSFFGLVPKRDQSGAVDKQLPISKMGNSYVRQLLVQSAQYILGPFGKDSPLRTHGMKLALRGGRAAKKKAVIAIARKLSVMMLSMWQNAESYRTPQPSSKLSLSVVK